MVSNRYHFTTKNTTYSDDDLILSQNISISKDISNCLTNFQVFAINFLYKNFETHKACILNDESGLGKTASVAVFLSAILSKTIEKRKCLIICKNEERIINWKFHFDILTNLSYKVIFDEREIGAQTVYLTKWESLRSSASLANFNFDCIIVDDRDNLMSNKICLAYLLRNYENKISLVISSQDVTIDLKQFHSILRLCGRLETRYLTFKNFEEKFSLPNVQQCSSDNQNMLESYFLRREKILDYCRDFCLRRYRHQYENQLPLVATHISRLNIKKWQEAPLIREQPQFQLSLSNSSDYLRILTSERDTEDLHNSYISKSGKNDENATELLESFFTRHEEDELNDEVTRITTTIADTNPIEQNTEVMMSPLVFIADSDNENNNDDDILVEIVSSTTEEKKETNIVLPTPINFKKPEVHSAKKRKARRKKQDLDDDKSATTRLTRCQERITRSQSHKNKYLTLSIDQIIKKNERENKILKNKRKKIKDEKSDNHISDNSDNETEDENVTVVSTTNNNVLQQNAQSFSQFSGGTFTPIAKSKDKDFIRNKKASKSNSFQPQFSLSGFSLPEPSETVRIIDDTPEIIVLSSSTDSSFGSQNNFNKTKLIKPNASKSIPSKSNSTSPDIFGSLNDYGSNNITCSQKSKHMNYDITKKSSNEIIPRNDLSCLDILESEFRTEKTTKKTNNYNTTECEIIETTHKTIRATDQDPDNGQVTSSSQTIEPSQLEYPKTPKKRKPLNGKNVICSSGSSSKVSPHSKTVVITPTKTPNTLRKWLMKSNITPGVSSSTTMVISDKDDDILTPRSIQTKSTTKRRRLDISFKN